MTSHPGPRGVDISSHQGDWRPSANDDFVFIKATEGTTYKNPKRASTAAAARKAGLVVGFYHWLWPGKVEEQAKFFVRTAEPLPGDLLWVDWEHTGGASRQPSVAEKDAFIRAVKRLAPQCRVGLYCNTNWWTTVDTSDFYGDALWIAQYGSSKPRINDPWTFWQYTDSPIDTNTTRFASVDELRAWARGLVEKPPAPKPKEEAIVIEDRERIPFRNAGITCSCVVAIVPLVEARLRAAGLLEGEVRIWQLGYRTNVRASAMTHAKGGTIDVIFSSVDSTAERRIWRECGVWMYPRYNPPFSDEHGHGIVVGCPHLHPEAEAQLADARRGRDGLARHGVDPGPRVALVTWKDALKAYGSILKEGRDMSQLIEFTNTKEQALSRESWRFLDIDGKGLQSIISKGPCQATVFASLRISGLKPGDAVQVRARVFDWKKGAKRVREWADPIPVEIVGTAGDTYAKVHVFDNNIGKATPGYTRRLRLEALAPYPVKIKRLDIQARKWS